MENCWNSASTTKFTRIRHFFPFLFLQCVSKRMREAEQCHCKWHGVRERLCEQVDALAIGLIKWYEDVGWYAHSNTHQAKWFVSAAVAVFSRFILSFILLTLHNSVGHAFLTIYVLYWMVGCCFFFTRFPPLIFFHGIHVASRFPLHRTIFTLYCIHLRPLCACRIRRLNTKQMKINRIALLLRICVRPLCKSTAIFKSGTNIHTTSSQPSSSPFEWN